jgi:hypothetical protein
MMESERHGPEVDAADADLSADELT